MGRCEPPGSPRQRVPYNSRLRAPVREQASALKFPLIRAEIKGVGFALFAEPSRSYPPPMPPPSNRRAIRRPLSLRRSRSAGGARDNGAPSRRLPRTLVPKLGELLLKRGHVSAAELAAALIAQRESGRRLGCELVECASATRQQVDDALWLQRCIATVAFASATSIMPLDVDAGSINGPLSVGATVPLVAAMQMHFQPASIDITTEDIARGYVDVSAATRFSVATTSREGYMVDFVPTTSMFAAYRITSRVLEGQLPADGGTLVARGRPRRDANAELSYRFVLGPQARPGRYPFPLHIVVRPL